MEAANVDSNGEARPDKAQATLDTTIHESEPKASETKPQHHVLSFYLVIFCLFIGTFLIALDQTIIAPAIPKITSQFNALDDISWYGSAYLIALTAMQPTYGKFYKYEDVKFTYLAAIALFEAGSLICGFAPTSAVFIAGRSIAGIGGAGLVQGAFAIITYTVPLQKRPFYISLTLSTYVLCVCIGPVIGGAFTTDVTWRWVFWINGPIGAVVFVLIAVIWSLPESHLKKDFRSLSLWKKIVLFDPVSSALIVGVLVCFLFALQIGGVEKPWRSTTVIGLLVGSFVIAALFVSTQVMRGPNALLSSQLLGKRSISACAVYLIFIYMPTYIYGYWIPLYFQSVRGYSPIGSARNYLALAMPTIVSMVVSGSLSTRYGFYMPYIVAGTAVSIIGMGFITTFSTITRTVVWAIVLVSTGLGQGFAQNAPYTAVQFHLREDDVPSGNALLQFATQLGGSIGHAVSQTLFLNVLKSTLAQQVPQIDPAAVIRAGAYDIASLTTDEDIVKGVREAYAQALRNMFVFPLVVACVAFCACWGIENGDVKREAERRGKGKEEDKEKGKA